MTLAKPFKETVAKELRANKGFRVAMLCELVDCFLSNELEVGKSILRDYINATIGFEKLGKKVGVPPKSLMRMFGPSGNPQAKNLFAVIGALQKNAGIELHVAAE
ncbi:MAG TPA: transcriptional regulator [Rhizomicrobium sp.]